jgi:hypothetical protein
MASTGNDFPQSNEPFEIKNWWDSIINEEGSCPLYAFFLLLPSDGQMGEYLSESAGELNSLSGNNCLILIIHKEKIQRIGTDPKLRSMESLRKKNKKLNVAYFRELLKDQVSEGYSIRMADYFKVPTAEFPCLVFFQGIFSQEHILITFSNMDKKEIAPRMREIFSVIQEAASANTSILRKIESLRTNELFQREGKVMISTIRNIAGKTFQIAIEVWIKSLLGKKPEP